MVEADTVEGLTTLLRPPILQDHEADVVPVTTIGNALDTLDLKCGNTIPVRFADLSNGFLIGVPSEQRMFTC